MPEESTHPADHPLTYKQKCLVQDSWGKVVPIADTAAELFYGKLFELDPNLKPLFKNSDMKEQGKKLMQMIGAAVKGLGETTRWLWRRGLSLRYRRSSTFRHIIEGLR